MELAKEVAESDPEYLRAKEKELKMEDAAAAKKAAADSKMEEKPLAVFARVSRSMANADVVKNLRKMCEDRGLSPTGQKKDLVARLVLISCL